MSQERLAATAKVDRGYVGLLEREEANATVDLLDKLAAALNVRLGELFEEPAEGEQKPSSLRSGRRRSIDPDDA